MNLGCVLFLAVAIRSFSLKFPLAGGNLFFFWIGHEQLKDDESLVEQCLPHWQSCQDLEAAPEAGLGDSLRCSLAPGFELRVGKSLAGRKAAVFCQAGIEILEKLLPFSDLITVNYDNFPWK